MDQRSSEFQNSISQFDDVHKWHYIYDPSEHNNFKFDEESVGSSNNEVYKLNVGTDNTQGNSNIAKRAFKKPLAIRKAAAVSISLGTNIPLNLFTIF